MAGSAALVKTQNLPHPAGANGVFKILRHTLSHIRLTFTLNIQTEYSHVVFQGVRPLAPTRPKWMVPSPKKTIKISDLKTSAFFFKNGAPWDPIGHPKTTKIAKSCSLELTFYLF